ncbi:DUF2057 domain-containing protein [Enterovibrio sp. ZSDZ35]|uniref:DUF2057 domain-containing protein n=1 Tax=Enterovibrio qingdaonensis TaxID=2899818 RepID=A0ABT5QQQ2_9GAMM|nr:DUF2057 family protein [Enterovibrio sp. ZSDZ35]MDD1783308.1 DUF2057 domain-containing protein [Enterovibrio sp. ZSDZ35]
MKRIFKSLFIFFGFLPLFAHAAVDVELSTDVEAIVVNGEELPLSVTSKTRFSLPNGVNQLVVRVSKLVQTGGSEWDKFKTDPLVLTFNVSDTSLEIRPTKKIFAERDIGDFKKNPSFVLVANNGQEIQANQMLLPKGKGLLRDYQDDIDAFNKVHGIEFKKAEEMVVATKPLAIPANGTSVVAPVVVAPEVATSPVKAVQSVTVAEKVKVSSGNSMILMQADFLRMSAEEQQQFLQWAVENVRS